MKTLSSHFKTSVLALVMASSAIASPAFGDVLKAQKPNVTNASDTLKSLKSKNSTESLTPALKDLERLKVIGGNSGGGGKGIACRNPDPETNSPLATPYHYYLADTFDLLKSGKIDELSDSSAQAIISAAHAALDARNPAKIYPHPYLKGQKVSLGWMIDYRHQELFFLKGSEPEITHDANIDSGSLPEGCKIVQLAYQDIPNKLVHLTLALERMSSFEKGFLNLHEVLVSLRGEPGADTTPIRKDVAALALDLTSKNSQLREDVIQRLSINAHAPQFGENGSSKDKKRLHEQIRYYCGSEGDPKTRECDKARADFRNAQIKFDQQNRFPIVQEIPRNYSCKVTSVWLSRNGAIVPTLFSMTMTSEDARPSIWSSSKWSGASTAISKIFQLKMNGSTFQNNYSRTTVDAQMRAEGIRPYADFGVSTHYQIENKLFEISLDSYNNETETMSGSLVVTSSNPTTMDAAARVNCYVGKLSFE